VGRPDEFPVPRKSIPDKNRATTPPRRGKRRAARPAPADSNGNARPQLFRNLLEGLQDGVAHVSRTGVILYANARFAEMVGSRPNGIAVGASLKNFVSPASWRALDTAFARGLHLPTEGEMRVEGLSGQPRTIRIRLAPMQLAKDVTIGITAREVTELVEKDRALKDSEASLHSLSARILQLQDQERRRIARDLHDITGQELAVVVMSLSHLANNLDRPDTNTRQSLLDAVQLVRKVEDEVRTLSYVMHPPLLDEFGLGSALNWYVEGFTKRSGIEVQVDCHPHLPRLSTEKETALFRVVQESLTNVLRHSGSHKARIRVFFDSARVTLSVQDEGRGIEREKLVKMASIAADSGVGIAGMRERLQQLGGSLDIHPRPRGTEVMAVLPIAEGERVPADSEGLGAGAVPETKSAVAVAACLETAVKKRVLIVDDHEVTRRGIRSLLQDEPDIEICGEAQDGFEGVQKARQLNPDLVIMDIGMSSAGGFSAATAIRHSGLPAKILFFTTHGHPEFERMSQVAGFEAFVHKTNAARDLVRGVRAVLSGKKFYSSEVLKATAPHA
jgi:two-component system, NarL family, sensor kinase